MIRLCGVQAPVTVDPRERKKAQLLSAGSTLLSAPHVAPYHHQIPYKPGCGHPLSHVWHHPVSNYGPVWGRPLPELPGCSVDYADLPGCHAAYTDCTDAYQTM